MRQPAMVMVVTEGVTENAEGGRRQGEASPAKRISLYSVFRGVAPPHDAQRAARRDPLDTRPPALPPRRAA